MKQKSILIVLLVTLSAFVSSGQNDFEDISVDEAIAMMKKTSAQFLKGEFTDVDATGVDQYVDVEIERVYSFSDYSIGAVLPYFRHDKDDPQKMYNRKTVAKVESIIRLGKEHLTSIMGYAALVDYVGITKYHERVPMTCLFFFDWTGKIVGARARDFNRSDYAVKFLPKLIGRLSTILIQRNDPAFIPDEYWISDTKTSTQNNRDYEMTWCYFLEKNPPLEDGSERGLAKIYYYQIQKGLSVVKSLLTIYTQYEISEGKIKFKYNESAARFDNVNYEYTEEYDTGDFKTIHYEQMTTSFMMTRKIEKMLLAASEYPETFEIIDNDTVHMSEPLQGNVYTFKRKYDVVANVALMLLSEVFDN